MSSVYPGSLDAFTAKTDGVDYNLAAHINDLQDAVTAVQTELGLDPAGSEADVVARFNALDALLTALEQVGESVLASPFTISGAAGVYQDTGLSITLPSAGTYLINANVRSDLTGNAGTSWWINAKLYNSTDSADVANSERMVVLTNTTGANQQLTAPITVFVTVAASKTIKLYVCRNGTGTPSWTRSNIYSDSNGRTLLSYHCVAH
ncbi:MAG: hypothetical protein ACOYZ6_08175 [Chloroflexota bacterium]